MTKPCAVHKLKNPPGLPSTKQRIRDDRHGPTSWISITLHEGKFRQIRKMTSAVGFPTLRLARVRIGTLTRGLLELNNSIRLSEIQISRLFFNHN